MKRGLWLIGAVLLAYGSAVPGDFVWLDHTEIERAGYRVEGVDDLSKVFRYSLDRYLIRDRVQPAEMPGGYFRPIYALSISADWSLFGARPAFFHFENLLWHVAVALLLYALGLRLFARLYRADTIAFCAALLFAVHPLAIQSVSWISGRKDAMCAAFLVAALLALFRAGEQEGSRRFVCWSVAAGVATLLASLSKELGLLIPVLASALVWLMQPAQTGAAHDRRRRTAQALVAPWCAAAAVVAYRVLALGVSDLHATRPADSFAENVATSATLLWRYVGSVLLPGPPRLSDGWPIVQAIGPLEVAAIAGLLLVAGLSLLSVWRRGPLAAPLMWLAVLAAPASGLVPLRHFHAERYLYPAYWGLLAVVWIGLLHYRLLDRLLPGLASRTEARKWGFAGLAAVALATAGVTATSNLVWWSDETLFRDAIERDPHYVEGRLGLALHAYQQGELAESVVLSRRAIEDGNSRSHTAYWAPFVAYLNLAGALDGLHRSDEAYSAYLAALGYRPDDQRVLCRAGRAALALEQPRRAVEHLTRASQLVRAERSGGPKRVDGAGFECELALALAHSALAEWAVALQQLERLTALRPRNLPARRAWIRAQLELGHLEQANLSLRSLRGLAPERADLLALEAWVLFRQSAFQAATDAWHRGHELDPAEPLLWQVAARFESAFASPAPLPPPRAVQPGAGGG